MKTNGKVDPYLKSRINNIQLHIDHLMSKYEPDEMREILIELIKKKVELVEMV